jgi:L-aspartate oxidase
MCVEPDVLIIGCGIAGAAAAIRLAKDTQREILVLTRTSGAEESNTHYAQGGIVSRGPDDTPDQLVEDILSAGAGVSLKSAARLLAEEGPRLVQDVLIKEVGVAFDQDPDGNLSLTREGGHSTRRILHVRDGTGRAIEEALIAHLKELPNISLRTGVTAVDLITTAHHVPDPLLRYEPIKCLGAYALDCGDHHVHQVLARSTILATGGLGRVFKYTTNPEGARGDGLAMGYRAGARVVNAEYVQFHPTTLAVPGADNFLISEAVRGEGARLYTPDGRHFMDDHASTWGDLAPRDIVARAIHQEMVSNTYPHVLLDLAGPMSPEFIEERFPTIHAKCLEAGIDITSEPIPVVPAAHYACGGLLVDEWGKTSVERLYAVGEVSCTGLHGANRLASTSLLEALVWGHRAGEDIAGLGELRRPLPGQVPQWEEVGNGKGPDPVLICQDLQAVQDIMWFYVGLERSATRLARALRDLTHLWQDIESFYQTNRLTDELIGLRNTTEAALVVARAAWRNRQSRGTHYREDATDQRFASFHDAAISVPKGQTEF